MTLPQENGYSRIQTTPTVMEQLRSCTRAAHDTIEDNPIHKRLLSGQLDIETYLSMLQIYQEIHTILERQLDEGDVPASQWVWSAQRKKTYLLKDDIAHFQQTSSLPACTNAVLSAFINDFDTAAAASKAMWLGMLYVLEGSTLGGQILKRHIGATFQLTHAGMSYFAPYEKPGLQWRSFCQSMNQHIACPTLTAEITRGATLTFIGLDRVLRALENDISLPPTQGASTPMASEICP